jgi:hypothetical protein
MAYIMRGPIEHSDVEICTKNFCYAQKLAHTAYITPP